MDILEYLLSYWTNGFTTLIFVTLLLGSIPCLALWLDGKLEKLALQEILAELRNEVCVIQKSYKFRNVCIVIPIRIRTYIYNIYMPCASAELTWSYSIHVVYKATV